MTYEEILKDLKNKKYSPIYFLMGEEPYFIDLLTDFIAKNVLTEEEKTFNQIILYGKDTDIPGIINTARRFPMMSDHQVVIVKEAQGLAKIEDLIHYVDAPLTSTLLVINYKYKKLDKRKKLFKAIEKQGVILDSRRLYDDKIPAWIGSYLNSRGKNIEPKAAIILTEFLGNDLSKIVNELEKLVLILGEGEKSINARHIEENIGISKDYNNFELNNALAQRNVLKANRIVKYFESNPRAHPIALSITSIYFFFSKLLNYHFLKDKSRQNVASVLKIDPFFIREYERASQNYNAQKTVHVISLLREFDLKSKGFGNVSASEGDLLKELVFKIIH
ncbi:DNA polymerase III subunit delta [Bacteroidota bacterium]